ncbi:MAG: HD domain-containing protein [Chloroflexota bacterium]|nr:HD domain-containing protein [Chloroflexota bacterium]
MGLPRSAKAWIGFVVAVGSLAAASGVVSGREFPPDHWLKLGLFTTVAIFTDIFRVRLARFNIAITVSTVIAFGAALSFGTPAVVLAIGSFVADLILRKPLTKALFNATTFAAATWCSAMVWHAFGQTPVGSRDVALHNNGSTTGWIVAGMVFVLVNAVAVVTVVALADRSNFLNVVRSSLSSIAVQLLTLPTLGWMVMKLYAATPFSLIIITLPLVALYFSLRSVEQVREQTLRTIEKLSDVIDRRDPATEQHSERVAQYTALICDQLGLPADFTEITVSAARVHDLGKVAVPDSILFKPGRPSPEEWSVIRQHPVQGADLLSSIPTYKMGAGVIRHHHERWDGKGYPDGLRGEEIPLGARIVAVADAYDVMTSTRPYSRAVHMATAVHEIRVNAGTQFDPKVVEAFIAAMGFERQVEPVGWSRPTPSEA